MFMQQTTPHYTHNIHFGSHGSQLGGGGWGAWGVNNFRKVWEVFYIMSCIGPLKGFWVVVWWFLYFNYLSIPPTRTMRRWWGWLHQTRRRGSTYSSGVMLLHLPTAMTCLETEWGTLTETKNNNKCQWKKESKMLGTRSVSDYSNVHPSWDLALLCNVNV